MPIDIEETNIGAHAILVDQEGKIILQKRDDNPEIVNPGLISVFGGSSQKNEPIEVTLARELKEELKLELNNYKYWDLNTFYKTNAVDGIDYELHLFVVENVNIDDLTLLEGKGFFHDTPEKALGSDKLTRICREIIEYYLKNRS